MSDHEPARLIDVDSAVDIGQGYSLAWVIDVDGKAWPVLYDTRQRDPQFLPYLAEHFREVAPHELTGRLPDAFQMFRCGARTYSGRPCRSRVLGPGVRCPHHRESAEPPVAAASQEQLLFNLDELGPDS